MIFLERIRCSGFQLFKEKFELELDQGVYTILGLNQAWESGSNNAAGKTTLLNIVCWGLFGRTPDGAQKDEAISYTANHVHVEVHLSDMIVVRTKTRKKGERLKITYKGMVHKQEDTLTISENQKKLNEYLGIDFKIFCNAVHLSEATQTVDILECTDSDRGKMIEHIVSDNTAVWKEAIELVKLDEKKEMRELERAETLVEVCDERLDELTDKRNSLAQEIQEALAETKRNKATLRQEKRKIKRELESCKTIINGDPLYSMDDLTKQRRVLSKEKDDILESVARAEASLENLGTFRENDEACPMCLQLITKSTKLKLREIMNDAEAEIVDLREAYEALRIDIQEIEEDMENCRLERTVKVEAQNTLKDLKRDYFALRDQAVLNPNLKHIQSRVDEIEYDIQKNETQLKRFRKDIINHKKKLGYFKRLKTFMGPEMRNFILDRVREKLKMYCREFMELTTGSTYRLKFPSTNDRGEEKFTIEVWKGDTKYNIRTLSGGEKWRIKFAIILAFRSILFESVKTRFGFMLVDDSLGKLDDEGIETFYTLLTEGRNIQIPQVLIAVPRADMVRNDDKVLTVHRNFDDTVEVI